VLLLQVLLLPVVELLCTVVPLSHANFTRAILHMYVYIFGTFIFSNTGHLIVISTVHQPVVSSKCLVLRRTAYLRSVGDFGQSLLGNISFLQVIIRSVSKGPIIVRCVRNAHLRFSSADYT
jgi:hypothetical protein